MKYFIGYIFLIFVFQYGLGASVFQSCVAGLIIVYLWEIKDILKNGK